MTETKRGVDKGGTTLSDEHISLLLNDENGTKSELIKFNEDDQDNKAHEKILKLDQLKFTSSDDMVNDVDLEPSSEQNASFLSGILFFFVAKYLWRTRHGEKDSDLLEQPLDIFKSHNAVKVLSSNWMIAKKKGKTFFTALWKTIGKRTAILGILLFLEEAVHLAQPIFMGRLMAYFRPGSAMTEEDAYLAAAGVAVSAIVSPLIHHPYFYGLLKLGSEARIGTSSLLFDKGLKLSSASVQQTSTGQLINLLSTDVTKFDTAFIFVHYVWLSPLLLLAYGYALWTEIGPACLAGFLALAAIILFQGYFSGQMGKCRRYIAERADKRLSVMNEIVVGVRVIKMYAWEGAFSNIVQKLRNFEMKKVQESSVASAMVMGLFFTSGKLAVLFALLTYIYLGYDVTAERIFVASALYNSCRLPFSLFLPFGIHMIVEMKTTTKRIQSFLTLKEFSRTTTSDEFEESSSGLSKHDQKEPLVSSAVITIDKPTWNIDRRKTANAHIKLDKLTTLWSEDNYETFETASYGVKNVSLNIKSGECVAIIGQVGSGKSSILSSILGEAKLVSGHLDVLGQIAYCGQEAWIFSGTVRDNILFGKEYNEEEYKKVVKMCQLLPDFAQLSNGELTAVGDRGSTLSGGQRARVSLARAIYSDADIYLLDDPLSAVDANVGRIMYEKVINGYLRSKLVVLVTHQTQFLHNLRRVVLMKDSKVLGCSKLESLKTEFSSEFVTLEMELEKPKEEKEEKVPRCVSAASARRTLSSSSERRMSVSSHKEISSPTIDFPTSPLKMIENELFEEKEEEDDSKDEERGTGSVSFSVYMEYIKAMGTLITSIPLAIFVVFVQILFNAVDWWLNRWVTAAEKWNIAREMGNSSNLVDRYNIFSYQMEVDFKDYQWSFTLLTVALLVLGVARCIWFRLSQNRASRVLHRKMFDAVVNTHIDFFDNNPIGRILNRFSKDIGVVDDALAFVFFEFIMGTLSFTGTLLVIVFINPMVFLSTCPLVFLFVILRIIYVKRSRELKRIEAITRSPMNTHVSAVMGGLTTVRAYGRENEMLAKFHQAQDMNTAAFNLTISTARWFAICIDALVALFVTGVAFVSVHQYRYLSSGEVALTLVYAVQLTGFFSWIMRQSAELQNGMVSVERIAEYTKLESEHICKSITGYEDDKHSDWPSSGAIDFKDVNVYYGDEKVLSELSFQIPSKQKIGIAGRTGAGKSTLLRVLFGLKPVTSGKIRIGNVDVDTLSLQFRRKGMAIIPQEPILFIGTVRRNLDPFDEHSDSALWEALDQCELKDVVTEMGGLSAPMQEGGSNFSVGQRQLVCLARALIHHAKILVIDEATANVDARTDAVIQNTIRTRFADSTVLTIAHRLNTIMESDKVMVFEHGNLIEFDSPTSLMENETSALWKLASQTGKENARLLRKAAKDHHSAKSADKI